MSEITQAELKKYLEYDPDTGIFTWIKRGDDSRFPGDNVAGYLHPYGYIRIQSPCKGVQREAHRLAFLYMTGKTPAQVDHINHIRDDNRWCNLRAADPTINSKNRSLQSNNKSGIVGVSFNKRERKWCVNITVDRHQIFLGYYKNKNTAFTIRKGAELWYGFHKNHGEIL